MEFFNSRSWRTFAVQKNVKTSFKNINKCISEYRYGWKDTIHRKDNQFLFYDMVLWYLMCERVSVNLTWVSARLGALSYSIASLHQSTSTNVLPIFLKGQCHEMTMIAYATEYLLSIILKRLLVNKRGIFTKVLTPFFMFQTNFVLLFVAKTLYVQVLTTFYNDNYNNEVLLGWSSKAKFLCHRGVKKEELLIRIYVYIPEIKDTVELQFRKRKKIGR